MPFGKGGGCLGVVTLGNQVIGGRGGVAQHQIGFAFQEQTVGFGPAGGDGDDVVGQGRPDFGCAVAIGGLHPHQQSQPGRGRAGVLDDDGQVGRRQRLERSGRGGKLCAVIDKGEPAPVKGQEQRIGKGHGQGVGHRQPMRREQPRGRSGGREVGVQTQHHIGVGPRPFKLHPRQQGSTVACRDELQVTGAIRLEGFLHGGAGAPFGGKAVIGQHSQHGRLCRRHGGNSTKPRSKDRRSHLFLLCRDGIGRAGGLSLHLPSAGMIRFRFNGSASLHLSPFPSTPR